MISEDPKDIYSSMEKVWPDNNRWYNYTHKVIIKYVEETLNQNLDVNSVYLNAGSGGSTYNIPGTCYHMDIASNLINKFPNHYVASVENMPFDNNYFDAIICVGSVLNYCSALESISELSRTLKPDGILILEFERSNTSELWFSKEYSKKATIQQYEYLGHMHTLWLYSEKYIKDLLQINHLNIDDYKRFHCLSALANRITNDEEASGRFSSLDFSFLPLSYLMAHNMIMLCTKIV